MDPRDALEDASVRAFFARRAPGRAEPAAAAAWAAAALGFLRRAHAGRFFVYFAFGHVHTATAAISADRQYAGCAFAGTGARPFVCLLYTSPSPRD